MSNEVISIIVDCTNWEAERSIGEHWKKTDAVEIQCYIGLLINASVNKQGLADYKEF